MNILEFMKIIDEEKVEYSSVIAIWNMFVDEDKVIKIYENFWYYANKNVAFFLYMDKERISLDIREENQHVKLVAINGTS